ncbi:hypothetical protein [Nitrosopumilus zosterae]|nr:hypothetical protein [Nitrosopumilus zosterae]BDQ31308.1 hypothetical protein NZOSNM25_001421 [Nitrosopumilus zosterae]
MKTDMDIILEDSILENASEWIHKTELWRKTKSDKKRCFDTIDYLVKEGFLETKKEQNKHKFRRKNEILTDKEFSESQIRRRGWMVDTVNAINNIEKPLFTYVKSRKQSEPRTKLIKGGLESLDYYMNGSTAHIARLRLAKAYHIINKRTADKRIDVIENTINYIANYFLSTNPDESEQIKEYNQRISRRTTFKI